MPSYVGGRCWIERRDTAHEYFDECTKWDEHKGDSEHWYCHGNTPAGPFALPECDPGIEHRVNDVLGRHPHSTDLQPLFAEQPQILEHRHLGRV